MYTVFIAQVQLCNYALLCFVLFSLILKPVCIILLFYPNASMINTNN